MSHNKDEGFAPGFFLGVAISTLILVAGVNTCSDAGCEQRCIAEDQIVHDNSFYHGCLCVETKDVKHPTNKVKTNAHNGRNTTPNAQ